MRRPALLMVPVALLIAAAGFVRTGGEEAAVPRFANITAACTPSENPQVEPNRIQMLRQDSIIWREPSGRSTQFTITPKDPEQWPFAQASFTGTPQNPAVTRRPTANAQAGRPYAYNVTINCANGTVQVIDPDIVIGDADDS